MRAVKVLFKHHESHADLQCKDRKIRNVFSPAQGINHSLVQKKKL